MKTNGIKLTARLRNSLTRPRFQTSLVLFLISVFQFSSALFLGTEVRLTSVFLFEIKQNKCTLTMAV